MIQQDCEIILASTSKIRKAILEKAALKFKTISPDFDEEIGKKKMLHLSIKNLAIYLAEQKALSISKKFKDVYVIGSDQICEFENQNISKSNNAAEALMQLQKLNGKIHYQNNAAVIALNGKIIFRNFSRVKMQMRKITQKEIASYVKKDQPWGSAGSYKYESFGCHLFKKISGDYHAILGLAIQPLLAFLHEKKLISIKQ